MSVTCKNCGEEWERDPALEVACPSCKAEVGQQCRRLSGHPCRIGHAFGMVEVFAHAPDGGPTGSRSRRSSILDVARRAVWTTLGVRDRGSGIEIEHDTSERTWRPIYRTGVWGR